MFSRRTDWLAVVDRLFAPSSLAAIASLGFFVLYVRRLCPTLCLIGDSAELVTASAIWGIPHPPGYPLFTAVGHAFARIPMGSVPWRVHLTSAVFHSATIGLVVRTTFALTRSRLAGLAAGWALGLSHSFLLGSLYAEVFPLNDLFFAGLLGLALSDRVQRGCLRGLVALAVLAGMAIAHHPMIALAAPALAVLLVRPLRLALAANARTGPVLLAAFFAPAVAAYALVPLAAARAPYLSWGDVRDVRSLVSLVLRTDYGGPFSAARNPSGEPWFARLAAFGALVAHSAGPATVALAVLGVAERLLRRPVTGASLLLAVAVSGPAFACANAIGTGSEAQLAYFGRFTTMCHVPLAIAFGAGVAALAPRIGSRRAALAGAAATAAWAAWVALSARDVDLRSDWRGLAFAHDLILSTPPRSLVLLSGDEPPNAALYVCAVERACGDRVVLSPGTLFLPWRLAQFRRLHPEIEVPWSGGPALARVHEIVVAEAPKRPVFVYPDLLAKDPALSGFPRFPDRLLFRLWPPGSDPPSQRSAFLASAGLLAQGECQGCRPSPVVEPAPSQEVELVVAYEAAFVNHARAVAALGAGEGLERALEARARAMRALLVGHGHTELLSGAQARGYPEDHGGGVSRSR